MIKNQKTKMLRNPRILIYFNKLLEKRFFHHENCLMYAKNITALKEGKILGKLYGNRVAGSKKKWFPSAIESSQAIFKNSKFGKSDTGSKTNVRRAAVLNKLFMEHITDLMATGEISETILGKGLQICKVKISPDFGFINVYWVTTGNILHDEKLETELKRCSGLLRHQLTQLDLMGEVPRIKFVKDKLYNNMFEVEAILKTINLEEDEQMQEYEDIAKEALEENFYCIKKNTEINETDSEKTKVTDGAVLSVAQPNVPVMRHDVLGLDHKGIMMKILTKMRKSKHAWELHQQHISVQRNQNTTMFQERLKKKLVVSPNDLEKFEDFLAKRREIKNTPERKKYRADDQRIDSASDQMEDYESLVMPEELRKLYEAEDYLLEDSEEKK
uniref:Ribosome-binding factor A n=1 Tax=Glossina brevipalpis TaxID=37001 RepID=A0A1A9W1Z3_9MUSC